MSKEAERLEQLTKQLAALEAAHGAEWVSKQAAQLKAEHASLTRIVNAQP